MQIKNDILKGKEYKGRKKKVMDRAPSVGDFLSEMKEDSESDEESDQIVAENILLRRKLRSWLIDRIHDMIRQKNDSFPLYSVKSFEQLNIPETLLRGISIMGFKAPSRIQEMSLPYLMANPPVSMIVQAQCGTGKTAAFLLASLSRIDIQEKYPQVLILSPTSELALQTGKVAEAMAKFSPDISFRYAVKGETQQRRETIREHVIIGTPDKIFEWVMPSELFNMKKIKVFVLDEADLIISNEGHSVLWLRIHPFLSEWCQMLLFSATYTEEEMTFAKQIFFDAVVIRLQPEEEILDNVKQYYMNTCQLCEDIIFCKYKALQNIYGAMRSGQVVIFCEKASWLANKLSEDGHSVDYLSSDMTKHKRRIVIDSFMEGKKRVLITTDSNRLRGIDTEQVTLVINFDLPRPRRGGKIDFETYLHRIGRTGRFGRSGIVLNLVSSDRDRHMLREIERHFGRSIQPINTNNYNDLETTGELMTI